MAGPELAARVCIDPRVIIVRYAHGIVCTYPRPALHTHHLWACEPRGALHYIARACLRYLVAELRNPRGEGGCRGRSGSCSCRLGSCGRCRTRHPWFHGGRVSE
jgi:hypothetical protein